MNKIAYISMIALLGATSLSSCSDYLESENKSAGINPDEYFKSETGKTAARVQAFYSLKSIAANYELNCAGTDLYVPVRSKEPGEQHRYTLTAQSSEVGNYYSNCYNLIKYAMTYAEKSGEGSLGNNEGRFLRDYAYYLLTQQFGGVPYIDYAISDANRVYPKAKADSIYNVVEQDLESIYNSGLLPETDHNGQVSKQAVAALLAKFYIAHAWDFNTTLTDAPTGTYNITSVENFQKAAKWADIAINGQTLTQSFEDKWSPSNEGNAEQIWSIQYERNGYPGDISKDGHGLQNMFGNYYGDLTKTGYKYVGSNGAQSEKALYLWTKGDSRYEATFMTKIYNWDGSTENGWGTTGYYGYYNGDTTKLHIGLRYFPAYTSQSQAEKEFAANKEKYISGSKDGEYKNQTIAYILSIPAVQYTFDTEGNWTKQSGITFSDLCSRVNGGTTIKKFDDPATQCLNSNNTDYRDIVVFDLSDMYLTAAEAYLMAGDEAKALTYVNAVRARANAGQIMSFSSYQAPYTVKTAGNFTALDVILDERARELYGQQVRWVDLRRTKQLVRYNVAYNNYISSVADMTGNDGNIKWLRPIPQQAFDGNYGLNSSDQNPGY